MDPIEWEDTDGDGTGNNMDWDDDEVLDEDDAYPLDIKRSTYKESQTLVVSIKPFSEKGSRRL